MFFFRTLFITLKNKLLKYNFFFKFLELDYEMLPKKIIKLYEIIDIDVIELSQFYIIIDNLSKSG